MGRTTEEDNHDRRLPVYLLDSRTTTVLKATGTGLEISMNGMIAFADACVVLAHWGGLKVQ